LTEKIYVVTDIGPGDGGKGGVVHRLATLLPSCVVIKRGGAQGSHGVRTSRGRSYNFSQWGCGTFEGIPTFISEQMIASPEGLLNEATALLGYGVHDPFRLISADPRALVATSFHGIASHVKELARGDNPRGTIGTGVGEAYRDYHQKPELVIRIRDLYDPSIGDRLEAVFLYQREKLLPILETGDFLPEDSELLEREKQLLYDDNFLKYETERFRQVAKLLRTASLYEILDQHAHAVVESSHGVITDRECGFQPHVSAIRTLPIFTDNMLRESGYDGTVVHLAVCRAYAIRHGAGPLPTADPNLAEDLLPGSNKEANRWQGSVRVGALDFVQMRKAISDSHPIKFDGLALTWLDQIQRRGVWKFCNKYDKRGTPIIESIIVPESLSGSELFDFAAQIIAKHIDAPVRMVSFGPTERDKVLK